MPFRATRPASRNERIVMIALMCVLLASVAGSLPFRTQSLGTHPIYIVFYGVILTITELLTAAVLLWRARVSMSARLAQLAAAYAYSTPLILFNIMLFPGINVLPGSQQATAWIWVAWHIGWTSMIAWFAFRADRPTAHPLRPTIVAVAVAALLLVLILTSTELPALLTPALRYTPLLNAMYALSAAIGFVAVGLLLQRWRRLDELDLWILAAALTIILDVSVTALGSARFSLGFYVARTMAVLSGTSVLIALIKGFVAQIAHADLTEAERRANRQLDFFAALGASLGRTLDRNAALRALSESLVPGHADWTLVNLENAQGVLVLAAAFHRDPELARTLQESIGTTYDLPAAKSVSAAVFASHEARFATSVTPAAVRGSVTPAFADLVERLGLRSYIAVPIVADGVAYGTFHAVASESETAYTERDVPFFEEIGRRMGYALQRADLYARERRIAHTFQSAALPAELPAVPGIAFSYLYEAASREANVGGDFYDAFRLADGRVVVSIGDVAGAGVGAAAMMAAVRQSIRAIASVNPNPDVLLRAAEGAFGAPGSPLFATAFVGVIDPITFSLRYANAGHPPPILCAPDTSMRLLGSNDVVLGLPFGGAFNARQVGSTLVEPGSLLALYTDGLSEAHRDALAGEAELFDAVGRVSVAPDAANNAARLIRDLVLGGDTASHDDMALLTVSFEALLKTAAPLRVTTWDFACDDGVAGHRVREEVVLALCSAGFGDDDIFSAETIFSELVGNGLRHAYSTLHVVLDLTQSAAVLHVIDGGSGNGFYLNSKLPADALEERGRGLFIIAQLSQEFTVSPRTEQTGSHARVVLQGRVQFDRNGARVSR